MKSVFIKLIIKRTHLDFGIIGIHRLELWTHQLMWLMWCDSYVSNGYCMWKRSFEPHLRFSIMISFLGFVSVNIRYYLWQYIILIHVHLSVWMYFPVQYFRQLFNNEYLAQWSCICAHTKLMLIYQGMNATRSHCFPIETPFLSPCTPSPPVCLPGVKGPRPLQYRLLSLSVIWIQDIFDSARFLCNRSFNNCITHFWVGWV